MLDKVIYLSAVHNRGDFVSVPKVWANEFYFDKDGNLIEPVDSNGELLTQEQLEALPNYGGKKPFLYEVGKADYIPVWDKDALAAIASADFFFTPDCEDQIAQWYNEGLTSSQIYENLIKTDKLVKSSDLGLDSIEKYSEPAHG